MESSLLAPQTTPLSAPVGYSPSILLSSSTKSTKESLMNTAMLARPLQARENTSGLEPLGRAILVEPWEPQRKASLIALPESVQDNERVLDVKVRIVEIGPIAWMEEPQPRAAVGDVVYVAKMSGFVVRRGADGKPYRFVNDRDVFARVTGESNHG